jgi:hypothetical protein
MSKRWTRLPSQRTSYASKTNSKLPDTDILKQYKPWKIFIRPDAYDVYFLHFITKNRVNTD